MGTLLIAIAITAIPLTWLTRRMLAARVQEEAVNSLLEKGIHIGYRHEWDRVRDCFSNAGPPGPYILRRLLGEHFFLVPDSVIVDDYNRDAAELQPLSKLTSVTGIGIVDSPIGDEVFLVLRELKNLEDLSLYGTQVTDKGILQLTALPRLINLVVSETAVTEDGVNVFKSRCPKCQVHRDNEEEGAD